MSVRTVVAARTSFLLREHGSGPGTPVLLLHGVPETSSCWRHSLPRLAQGRRVLAPDLPGLGGSSYTGPYDVPSLVEQLVGLVESEVGGGPVDVVGHDWGGALALALAGARPDLVRRLAVVNAPYRQVPMHRAVHIPFFALPVAPELLFRLGGRRVVRLMLRAGWRSQPPLDPDTQAEYEAAYARPGNVRAMLGYYRSVARPRLARALRRKKPAGRPLVHAERMLVLWGALDPVLPISTGESVVRDLGPECVMVTVPGAGHFVVEEAPDVVGDVLVDFLAEAGVPVPEQAAPPEGPAEPRVHEQAPPSGDLGDVPSVGPLPVGGTPADRGTPGGNAPPETEPASGRSAKKAAKKAANKPAKNQAANKPVTGKASPAESTAAEAAPETPSRKAAAGPDRPSPEAPPSPGTA